jgi:hypothetical protein
MGIFNNLSTDGLEKAEDRLGGFSALETDAYTGTVKLAYAGKSDGGALNVTVVLDLDGREYRETVYITNKKGENFFLNKQDTSKKVPLPGFTVINDLCICTTEAPLSEQPTEEKQVMVYDYDQKKELPQAAEVLIDLIGKPVTVGILQTLENKGVKQTDGSYADGPEERTVNNIDKVFHEPSKMTVVEATANGGWDADKAAFMNGWLERNKGKTRDKRSIKDGQAGTAGKPGAGKGGPPASGGGERKSLFGAKN